MRGRLLAVSLLALAAGPLHAQAPPPPQPLHVHTAPTPSPITVDGLLNDAAWRTADVCSTFVQGDPVEGARPSQRTEVRVLYDQDAIYFGIRCYDTSPDSIVSELSRRDGGTRSDRFYVYLDPALDRRSGYYFAVNVAGTQYDGTLYNDAWNDDSWDGVWDARAHRDAQGWTAEMRIPFSQLRFPHVTTQRWGINFMRQIARGFENEYLVCRPKKASGFVSLFPTLEGLEHVEPTNAIEVIPFATSKAAYAPAVTSDPFHDGSNYSGAMGGDLRMPVGGKLTLNATVNPDFGQVEVDPAVVNLSDVETFFPEKRPFFVEGSSIFDAGQQGASDYWGFNFWNPTFFYSRRIGHAPEGSVPSDAVYSDVPSGTTILGAAKLSGKLSPSVNLGLMGALTAREMATNQRSDLSQFKSEVEPMSYYGAARILKEFPERRHGVGTLITYVHRDLHDDALKSEFNSDAVNAVVDGWHFLDQHQTWVLSGYGSGTLIEGTSGRMTDIQNNSQHYFERPDARHLGVDSSVTMLGGYGARVWLNKEKGSLISNSAIGILSPGYDVNDLGFEDHSDWINAHTGWGYKWNDPTKNVKNHMVLGSLFGSANVDGDIVAAGVWTRAFWWFTNNWTLNPSFAYNPQTVNPRRSRGGPLMLNAPGYELYLSGDTDGSRKRYYSISYDQYIQTGENSFSYNIQPFVTFKPRSNLRLDVGPSYTSARDGAFYVSTVTDPTATATYGKRYVFARLDQTTFAANIRVNWSFTARMSLQFYGQPLIATGRYSDFRELAKPRSLDFIGQGAGAWTYDPTTRVFDEDGAGPAAGEVKDFNSKSLRGNAVFRWEFRPGSAFYLVWTQQRSDDQSIPDFNFGTSWSRMMSADAQNIFLAKVTYYLGM
jgi:hypothetical protein